MPIKFLCDHCGAKLQVATRKAGQQETCPRCREPITIPSPADAAAMLAMKSSDRYSDGTLAGDDEPFLEFSIADDEELVYETGGDESVAGQRLARVDPNRVSIPRMAFYIQGALLGVIACIFFVFGIMVGKYTTQTNARGHEISLRCRVLGEVHYRNDNQDRADEGAIVMLIPKDTRPNPRPDVGRLRPGVEISPDDPDQQVIREIGGALTQVSESGRFELTVASPRDYYLLVISNHRRRPTGESLTKDQRAEMGGYFLPVDQLVQDRQFIWRSLPLTGSSESLDRITF